MFTLLSRLTKIVFVSIFLFALIPHTQAVEGVPHLPQDYSKTALEWWNSHPYNPDTNAGNYIPVGSITNSGPEIDVCSQSGSNARDKIKNALSKIPKTGGTLKFRKACSPYDLGSGLEWIRNLYKSDFDWVNGGVNVDISDYNNLHMVADQPGTEIKGSFHIHSTAHVGSSCRHDPVKNFYFKNLTFNDPGNKHLAFIFEDTEDVLFDNVRFNNAGLLTVIKGNNFFFRDSVFNNGPLHFDGTQFAGIVNSQVTLDFSNHVGVYNNPYWVDFHQNNDASCDGDRNGRIDIYEERMPRYFVLDGNQFTQKSGKSPVVLGAVIQSVFQSNNIQGPISDFVKVHSDVRPNDHTGKYYSYTDYKFISNNISNADSLLNMDIGSRKDGGSFTRGDVTVAYTNATSIGKLVNGSAGSNLYLCGNKINGSNVDSATCNNLDTDPPPTIAPTSTPTPLPGMSEIISNFSVNSSNTYRWDNLGSSQKMYTDRSHTFTSIPSVYQGLYYLQTPNDDKQLSSNSNLMSFKAVKDITVYIAYTDENSTISSWLSGWTKGQPEIDTTLTGHEDPRLVAMRSFSAGETITLKGNGGTANETSMYNVIIKEGGSGSNPTPTATPNQNVTCQDIDINQDGVINLPDFSILSSNFLETNPANARADINSDGVVNLSDFSILASSFLQYCGGTNPTPTATPTNNPGSGTAGWSELGQQKQITSGITPSIAVDSQGFLHMVYMDNNGIYYRKGDNNGNFGSPEAIPTPVGPGDYNSPHVQVDDQDIPHVVFEKDWTGGSKRGWYTNRIGGSWKTPLLALVQSGDYRINYPRLELYNGNAYMTAMTVNGIIAKIENLASNPTKTREETSLLWVAYPAIDKNGKIYISGRIDASGHFIDEFDLDLNKKDHTRISQGTPTKSGEPTGGYKDSQGGMHVIGVTVNESGTEYLWYNSLNRAKAGKNVIMRKLCDCHVKEYVYPMIVEDERGRLFVTYTDRQSAQGKVTVIENDSILEPVEFASSVTQRFRWNPQIVAAPGGGVYAVWDKDNKVYFRSIGVGN